MSAARCDRRRGNTAPRHRETRTVHQPRSHAAMRLYALVTAVALVVTAGLTGCGSSSGAAVAIPKVAPARVYALTRIRTIRPRPCRPPHDDRVHDQTALGEGPHQLPEMLRTSRRRRPDHRPHRRQPRSVRRQRHRAEWQDHPACHLPHTRSLPGRDQRLPARLKPDAPEQLPAVHHRHRSGRIQATAGTAIQPNRRRRRISLPDPRHPAPPRDPSRFPDLEGDRPQRAPRTVHDLARRARPRDLLPPRNARLLPHPRLQPGRHLLQLSARRHQSDRQLHRPGQLKVGVLLAVPGTWRLFLITYIHGHHLTAPFTLHVA